MPEAQAECSPTGPAEQVSSCRAFAQEKHLLKVIKQMSVANCGQEGAQLCSSPSTLQNPAYSQVHSWHCSVLECREGPDPLSMEKMPICVRERRCK